jgi:uncharacterized membrane protein YvlD (DUF360 family)
VAERAVGQLGLHYPAAMVRFLIRTGVMLLSNALGLIVASIFLDGMEVQAASFIEEVIIFTIAFALMTPFMANQLRKRQSSALGGVALIATLIALIVTDVLSDGFSISGIGTWIAAAVIVWAASLLAAFILPYLGLKKYLEDRR